jgi:SnoaL-like domain
MSSNQVSESAMRMLLDKQEITEVLARYCRAIDRLDEELLRSVYWPDGYDDHMSFAGPVAEFIPEAIRSCASIFKSTVHSISNILIEVDGDVADSETYFISFNRLSQLRDGREYDRITCARYIDRFERRHGEWRIARRLVVTDWNRVDPVGESEVWGKAVGLRSREDPVYRKE